MAVPNLLNTYGIKTPTKTSGGLPDLVGKYSNAPVTPIAPTKPTLIGGITQGIGQTIKDLMNAVSSDVNQVKGAFTSGVQQANQGSAQASNAGGNILQKGEGLLNFTAGLTNAAFSPLAPVFSPLGQFINAAGEQLSKTPLIQDYGKNVVAANISPNEDPTTRILQAIQNASVVGGAILGSGLFKGSVPEVPTKLPVTFSTTEAAIPVHNGEVPLPIENAPTVSKPEPPAQTADAAENLKTQISIYEDAQANDPAKGLLKYYGRNDPRYSNLDDIFSRNVGKAKSGTLDSIVQELGFNDVQQAHEAVLQYLDTKDTIVQMKETLSTLKTENPKVATRSTTQTLKPIEGTGDIKTRGLSQSLEASAISQGLSDGFGDLPEFRGADFNSIAETIRKNIADDPESALAIAMGEKAPPKGTIPEMYLNVLSKEAQKIGDAALIHKLATQSKLTGGATTMGQRLAALGYKKDELSSLDAIQEVQDARAQAQAARGQTVDTEVAKAQKVIRQTNTKQSWAQFVDSITC